MRIHFIYLFFISLVLAACQNPNTASRTIDGQFERNANPLETQRIGTVSGNDQGIMNNGQQQAFNPARGKVAILLPLSGPQKDIGQALLQAAQLAVFDMSEPEFELLPFDTNGTPQGASAAVQKAASQNAKLILGPLLADNVAAAGITARQYNLNVIGFTTDWTKAGGNVMTIGILPFDQGTRMAQYAAQANKKRSAIINDNGAYSNAVISAFNQAARAYGISITAQVTPQTVSSLAAQKGSFDAILMPTDGQTTLSIGNQLNAIGLGSNTVLWMGTGLWDGEQIKRNPMMTNAVYAAPDPSSRQSFENNYRSLYGVTPPRLSSLAYDATALSVILLKQNPTVYPQNIMNASGFSGIDGIFRIQSNGLAQRGLAIHRITGRGDNMVINQAPKSF
jgi:branched-chain amino acid transport system substrate-binding protein